MIPDWIFDGNARKESETPRDGFLSTTVELHAIAIGTIFAVLYAITGETAIPVFFALLIMGKAKVSSGHLRDAAKEAGYSGITFVVVYAIAAVLL